MASAHPSLPLKPPEDCTAQSFPVLPSPIERPTWGKDLFPGIELIVKRDDKLDELAGCSKLRILNAALADMRNQNVDTIVCLAMAGSSLVVAAARVASLLGLKCIALVRKQAYSESACTNIDLGLTLNCEYVLAPEGVPLRSASSFTKSYLQKIAEDGRRPYLIPFGGTHKIAPLAYIAALTELVNQIRTTQDRMPDSIWVACATGRLACGLAAGLAKKDISAKIIAIGVSPQSPSTQQDFLPLIEELNNALISANQEPLTPSVILERLSTIDGTEGLPYGTESASLLEATKEINARSNLHLDTTYTARVFIALERAIASGNLSSGTALLWLSGGFRGIRQDIPRHQKTINELLDFRD